MKQRWVNMGGKGGLEKVRLLREILADASVDSKNFTGLEWREECRCLGENKSLGLTLCYGDSDWRFASSDSPIMGSSGEEKSLLHFDVVLVFPVGLDDVKTRGLPLTRSSFFFCFWIGMTRSQHDHQIHVTYGNRCWIRTPNLFHPPWWSWILLWLPRQL